MLLSEMRPSHRSHQQLEKTMSDKELAEHITNHLQVMEELGATRMQILGALQVLLKVGIEDVSK